jgi:hypothetical protein
VPFVLRFDDRRDEKQRVTRRCVCGHLLLVHREREPVEINEHAPRVGQCLFTDCRCLTPDWDERS